jgi:hypothetical protein
MEYRAPWVKDRTSGGALATYSAIKIGQKPWHSRRIRPITRFRSRSGNG